MGQITVTLTVDEVRVFRALDELFELRARQGAAVRVAALKLRLLRGQV